MNINEMVLVIENDKGTEINSLMTVQDYRKFVNLEEMDTQAESADLMLALGRTLGEENSWAECYKAANHTIFAKYCVDENMLESFLLGDFNDRDQTWRFDESISSKECLDKLNQIGLDTRGWSKGVGYHYEKREQEYRQGDVLRNLNHKYYRVMEKFSAKNLLLMDIHTGDFVVGVDVQTFARCPKGEEPTENNSIVGIEWGHGVYLSSALSAIDFRALRQEYGEHKDIDSLTEYRDMLESKFRLYHGLSKDVLACESIQAAATNAMYEEFGTGRPDTFKEHLVAGKYDGGFTNERGIAAGRSSR